MFYDLVEHIDAQDDQQAPATDQHIKCRSPDTNGNKNDSNKEGRTRSYRDPCCFKGKLEHVQDLLPDWRSGPALDPCNQFPVNAQEEQAKEGGKDKFCDHISTR